MKSHRVKDWAYLAGLVVLSTLPSGISKASTDGLMNSRALSYGAVQQAAPSGWRLPAVFVARSQEQEQAHDGVRAGRIVPLSMVLKTIRDRYPGKLLDARTIGGQQGNPLRYEVMWLTPDSRRLDIIADAATGKIMNVQGQ